MRVAFRADSSLSIGTGHIARCLVIAHKLTNPIFICKNLEGNIADQISDQGFEVELIDNEDQIVELIEKNSIDLLIIDHYDLDIEYEQKLKDLVKIVVIDDLANRKHYADILIDQNINRVENDYIDLLNQNCKMLIGTKYALIRDEFIVMREKRTQKIDKIVISMGGVDDQNFTQKVLNNIVKNPLIRDFKKVVIVGKNYPFADQLKRFCEKYNFELLININNMAEILNGTKIAIGAGGISQIERSFMGVASIIVPVAENQIESAKTFTDQGLALLADQDINDQLNLLIRDKELVKKMRKKCEEKIDGLGVDRVVEAIYSSTIST